MPTEKLGLAASLLTLLIMAEGLSIIVRAASRKPLRPVVTIWLINGARTFIANVLRALADAIRPPRRRQQGQGNNTR